MDNPAARTGASTTATTGSSHFSSSVRAGARARVTKEAQHMAKRPTHTRGFSIIELIVVIGIIAVLIGLLFPMLQTARQHAIRVECMNNLRTIGHGLIMYNNEQKHLP